MRRPWILALLLATAAASHGPCLADDAGASRGVEFFERKIRPVLVGRCYECHSAGAGKAKGGLRLDTREATRAGGDSGPAVVPGRADESPLVEAIRYELLEMPPDGKLADAVVADFEAWVNMGAPDPRDGPSAAPAEPAGIEPVAAGDLWSLRPIANPQVPPVHDLDWPRGPIDRFLLARLEREGLAPVADAGPERLLRRVSFDLVGLPPTPEQIQRFVADPSPIAFERLVDELLASLHFGERWGRHWLDIARYAESNGNAWNMTLPHAWRYRDYVIRSLNEDKPYDQFVVEQIAGDLLPAASRDRRDEQLIATGYLALGSKPFVDGETDETAVRPDWVDEQLDVVGKGLLGLTVACARCHDHKFDPIPQRDYYALAGIFFSTDLRCGPTVGKPPVWKQERIFDNAALALAPPEIVDEVRGAAEAFETLRDKLDKATKARKTAEGDEAAALEVEEAHLKTAMEQIKARTPAIAYAFGVQDAGHPGPARVRIRGVWDQLGAEVPRGFPSAVAPDDAPTIPPDASGRLELARWIVRADNPLASRVAVNRAWQHLFGRGIVETVDNFGTNGARPSHPELLDFLAHRFVHEQGWSLKSLIREIVTSRAYRLGAWHAPEAYAADPQARLLWRVPPRRLDAEALRDAILQVGGLLDPSPAQGSAVATLGYDHLNPKTVRTIHESGQAARRSVYLAALRGQDTDDLLKVFDFPDPGLVAGRREATTVPSQALYLLNSPLVREAADGLADRLLAGDDDDEARIARAYRIVLGREPNQAETRRGLRALGAFEGGDHERWSAYGQALLMSTEFRFLY